MMKEENYESTKAPHITVGECSGELVIRGWDDRELLAKGDDFEISESESGFAVSSSSRLRMMVPASATLSVTSVKGDLVIKNVNGPVDIQEAAGDVVLMGLGQVTIHTIKGDLSAKRIEGSIRIKQVHGDVLAREVGELTVDVIHGDLSAREVDGAVQLGRVMGDVGLNRISGDVTISQGSRDANLRGLGGLVNVADISGDIRLQGGLVEGKHACTASGDIVFRWPDLTPLSLVAEAASIVNRMDFDEVTESQGSLTGEIAGGQTSLSLTAQGSIVLKPIHIADEKWDWEQTAGTDFDFDSSRFAEEMAGLGKRISMQVNEQVARVTADLEGRFGPEFSQKMAEKIGRQAERAAAKAERAAEQAIRRAERSRRRSRWSGQTERGRSHSAAADKKKATSEEQLKILKMVEKGIITTEEAGTLLEALES